MAKDGGDCSGWLDCRGVWILCRELGQREGDLKDNKSHNNLDSLKLICIQEIVNLLFNINQ